MNRMDNQQLSFNPRKRRSISLNALKYKIEINSIYGVYKAIKQKETTCSKGKLMRVWKVEHIYTKQIFYFKGSYLFKLKEKVDIKSTNSNQFGLRNYLYRNCIQGAKNRNHNFNLSFVEFDTIITQPCYYCNSNPKKVSVKMIIDRGDAHQHPIFYHGIDRKDPLKDYSIENCVSCCSICNYMKHILQENEFLKQVEDIYNFRIKKSSTTIPKGSTLQANGSGNGEPLTVKAEGEDIVSSL